MRRIAYFATIAAPFCLATPVLAAIGILAPKLATPIPLQLMQNKSCHALAPAGWNVVDQDDQGATFSVASASRNIIAVYGVAGITGSQAAGSDGPQYKTPAAFAQSLASTVMGTNVAVTGTRMYNGMQVMNFATAKGRGFALYRVYPLPSDPKGYAVSVRLAIGGGADDISTAGAVVASIDCNGALKPPQAGYAEVHAKSAETGISQRCKSGDCRDADLAGTYNSELGIGYVHSASGKNYLVNPVSDDRDTVPNGASYYRVAGSTMEKLLPGRFD